MTKISKMTVLGFVALCTVVVIALLEIRGVHAVSGVAKFCLLLPLALLIVGLLPFLLGVLLQCIFHKRWLPPLIAWVTAAVVVAVQQALFGQAVVTALGQPVVTFVASFLIWGVAMDSGVRFCQGWREGKHAARAVPLEM